MLKSKSAFSKATLNRKSQIITFIALTVMCLISVISTIIITASINYRERNYLLTESINNIAILWKPALLKNKDLLDIEQLLSIVPFQKIGIVAPGENTTHFFEITPDEITQSNNKHINNFFQPNEIYHIKPLAINEKLFIIYAATKKHTFFSLINSQDKIVYAITFIGLLGLTTLLSFCSTKLTKRYITQPILNLIGVARSVSDNEQYSIRASHHHHDELKWLVDSFNHMLETIESRDYQLTVARNKAEKIAEREKKLLLEAKKSNNSLKLEIQIRSKLEKKLVTLQSYLNNILDSISSSIIAINQGFIITQCNSQALKLANQSQSETLDNHLYKIFPFLKPHIITISKTLIHYQTHIIEKAPIQLEHDQRFFEITIFPLSQSQTPGAVIQLNDITNRINLEELVLQNEKMRSLGKLASGLAQRIHKPLHNMIQNTHHIERFLSPDLPTNQEVAKSKQIAFNKMLDYLENRDILALLNHIKSAGKEAIELIATLVQFGQPHYQNHVKHSVHMILDSSIDIASHSFEADIGYLFKHVHIHKQYDSTLPAVTCNINDIQQVFINLLIHASIAIKAKHQNNPEEGLITIATRKLSDQVEIIISDNGANIPKSDFNKVFDPFYSPFTSSSTRGGLELAIAYFIITSQHNGTITVSSFENEGNSFTIYLPTSQNTDATKKHTSDITTLLPLAIDEIS